MCIHVHICIDLLRSRRSRKFSSESFLFRIISRSVSLSDGAPDDDFRKGYE